MSLSSRFLALLEAEGLEAKRVLDVGCGSGRLTLWLAPRVKHAIGLDRDARAIGEACRLATVAGIGNLEFHEADVEREEYTSWQPDLVTAYLCASDAIVERAGVSQAFSDLVLKQMESNTRGETSLDAWESRKQATGRSTEIQKHKNDYLAATFSDAISIYLLSLFIDVDYYDLRERDYPLLAPAQLAERLRKVAELFPPNPGYEFAIYHKRRG